MPTHIVSGTELQIIFAVIAVAFYLFVHHAWKRRKESWRLRNFFLAGAQLGPELTEHNSLGMTFAWAGGTWFFATTGFYFGPWVILMQIPWCISIVGLGLLFTKIHSASKNRTIHGFLDQAYGKKVRIIACVATTLGYIFNTGFELYWSGKLFSTSLGVSELALPISIGLAVVAAVYCGIGGYKANAATDKPQNILGVVSLTALAALVCYASSSSLLSALATAYVVGSAVYIIFSLAVGKEFSSKEQKAHSALAVLLATGAVGIAAVLCFSSFQHKDATGTVTNIFSSTFFPWHLFVGIVCFQLLFNVVDMANWQGIAANSDIPAWQHRRLKWSLIRSALYLNWFPAVGGTLIGVGLRAVGSGVTDDNIFAQAFATVLPGGGEIIRGFILGVLLLGFLCSTLSTADSYLMAAVHTITYDLFYPTQVKKLLEQPHPDDDERKFVTRARSYLLPLAILMVLVFWLAYTLYKKVDGNALDFQMIMYSFAISLMPSVLYALFGKSTLSKQAATASFWSILGGLLGSVIPYTFAVLGHVNTDIRTIIVNLTPCFSIGISAIIFGLLLAIGKLQHSANSK